jgi:hypothetical protein
MDLDLSEGAFEWEDEDMSEGPQEYGGLGINERVEQSSSSHGLEGIPDRGGRREGCCIVKTTISVKVRLEEEFEQEWKERGELLRKKEVEYLEEQTKEGEREFEDIIRKQCWQGGWRALGPRKKGWPKRSWRRGLKWL